MISHIAKQIILVNYLTVAFRVCLHRMLDCITLFGFVCEGTKGDILKMIEVKS